jgi:hypothetical protein
LKDGGEAFRVDHHETLGEIEILVVDRRDADDAIVPDFQAYAARISLRRCHHEAGIALHERPFWDIRRTTGEHDYAQALDQNLHGTPLYRRFEFFVAGILTTRALAVRKGLLA